MPQAGGAILPLFTFYGCRAMPTGRVTGHQRQRTGKLIFGRSKEGTCPPSQGATGDQWVKRNSPFRWHVQ